MATVRDSTSNLRLLSELLLAAPTFPDIPIQVLAIPNLEGNELFSGLGERDFHDLEALAASNHVILRVFEPLQWVLEAAGNDPGAEWVANSMYMERQRINHALGFLEEICAALENGGCPVTVMKSLDHWPDLGSDLDLYTDTPVAGVIEVMSSRFKAKSAPRSWGDRLANKWNFIVPGLPELVEVHAGRLGQTGEQTAITRSLTARSRPVQVAEYHFRVPAPEDRIIISTLQRMYRHFYIRLCDVVDNAQLLDSCAVDFAYLRSLGSAAGLWEGIATYLTIISEYVEAYRGDGVLLPSFVTCAAKFRADQLRLCRNFLRLPILPHSLNLYVSELKSLVLRGELRNSLRLSLLPGLATAAALEQKITGSDKGIW